MRCGGQESVGESRESGVSQELWVDESEVGGRVESRSSSRESVASGAGHRVGARRDASWCCVEVRSSLPTRLSTHGRTLDGGLDARLDARPSTGRLTLHWTFDSGRLTDSRLRTTDPRLSWRPRPTSSSPAAAAAARRRSRDPSDRSAASAPGVRAPRVRARSAQAGAR